MKKAEEGASKPPRKKKKKISISKKEAAMGTFYVLAATLTAVVVVHHNPLADQVTEMMKKVMACLLIAFTCVIFGIFYDRLTVLPKELYQSRRLIWKLAKMILRSVMRVPILAWCGPLCSRSLRW